MSVWGEVDDRQPLVAQGQRAVRVGTGIVRAASVHRIAHRAHRREVGRAVVECVLAGKTAHMVRPYMPRAPRRPDEDPAAAFSGAPKTVTVTVAGAESVCPSLATYGMVAVPSNRGGGV